MAAYYIHKVGSQEMGSVEQNDGKPQRGRYFLISKQCLEFFPYLSSVVLNDKAPVYIVPTYNNEENKKVLCTIDYHNQKFSVFNYIGKHPRNEVRLYMNQKIDPDLFFKTNDLAVFEKFDLNGEIIYGLSRIRPGETGYDFIIDEILSRAHSPYTNAIVDGTELSFVQKPKLTPQMQIDVTDDAAEYINSATIDILTEEENDEKQVVDNVIQDDILKQTLVVEEQMAGGLFNSNSFSEFVMYAYENRCAITRKVIKYNDLCNLEAAHIKPKAHKGLYLPCNGIALCRDLHFAFDKGFFTIDHTYKVEVAVELKGSEFYEEFNGKQMFVPQVDFFKPNPVFLDYHRARVYRTFKQIRAEN